MDSKTFYIENLGCAKNQVDAEVEASKLIKQGYKCINGEENAPQKADVIIVNTCAFIESARKESIDVFFELNEQKKKGSKIIITGCLGERYKKELEQELTEADEIRGVPEKPSTLREEEVLFSPRGTAFLKISEGCSHYCAFCAIPLIRGTLKSIDESEIIKEAKHLVKSGIKEINIIGQDLATYGNDLKTTSLVSLLKKLIEIDADFKMRCLYIHPDFFPDELIDVIKNSNSKIIPYFDIPIQHCNSEILHNMGRVHTKEDYATLVKKIRTTFDDSYVRTTFLLGFKGETEDTLSELEEYIKEVRFDAASFFLYSREKGTRGEKMMTVKEWGALNKLAKSKKASLEALEDKISSENLHRFVNREIDLLVEEKIEGTNLTFAHTPFQCPDVDGTVVLNLENRKGKVHSVNSGDRVKALITKVNNLDLEGVIL